MPFTDSDSPFEEYRRSCLLSGASGYLGGRIKEKLVAAGWRVIELSRNPNVKRGAVQFKLGEPIDPQALKNCRALIHCAYDFSKVSWKDIYSTNVRGSELLLHAAQQAGVERLMFISTISAFTGCRSLYGKGKLEVERITHSLGGLVIRPGLIYGNNPGGVLGRLIASIERSRIIPIPGKGMQPMYLAHEADVAEAVLRFIQGTQQCETAVTVAHEDSWPFRSLLLAIANCMGRTVSLVPIPWRFIWSGLRLAELLSIPIGFRSDSLISLINQNLRPNLNSFEASGVRCRPFQPDLLFGSQT